jgi:hypothetical protein
MKEDNNNKKSKAPSLTLSKQEHIKNTNEWKEFSMNPQKEEDIKKKLLEEMETGYLGFYICMSYICRFSKLSEDFIEELERLTTYNKKVHEVNYITKKSKNYFVTDSRLDWTYICQYQKLSEDFIERHENDVLWALIYQYQELSDEFKRKHIDQLNRETQSRILKSEDIESISDN